MAHAALERMVDFIGGEAPTRLIITFKNWSIPNQRKLFVDMLNSKDIQIDVDLYKSAAIAEFTLRGQRYRCSSNTSQMTHGDRWEPQNFVQGSSITFKRGATVLEFNAG